MIKIPNIPDFSSKLLYNIDCSNSFGIYILVFVICLGRVVGQFRNSNLGFETTVVKEQNTTYF